MDEPKQREIDCTSFNFHLPQDRSYAIFDPQSQEENDRLDALLGATPLWQAVLEEQFADLEKAGGGSAIQPFSWLIPVGKASTSEEAIAVIVVGAVALYKGERQEASGQWFVLRYRPETREELIGDLRRELSAREKAALDVAPPGGLKGEC